MTDNKVSWFRKAVTAVKAAATKVVSTVKRAARTVKKAFSRVLKTRVARVIIRMAKYVGSLTLIAVGIMALVIAPLQVLVTAALLGVAYVAWRFLHAALFAFFSARASHIACRIHQFVTRAVVTLGLYPTPASRLALRVFYDDAIGWIQRHPQSETDRTTASASVWRR
jgi:hypothetical protein